MDYKDKHAYRLIRPTNIWKLEPHLNNLFVSDEEKFRVILCDFPLFLKVIYAQKLPDGGQSFPPPPLKFVMDDMVRKGDDTIDHGTNIYKLLVVWRMNNSSTKTASTDPSILDDCIIMHSSGKRFPHEEGKAVEHSRRKEWYPEKLPERTWLNLFYVRKEYSAEACDSSDYLEIDDEVDP